MSPVGLEPAIPKSEQAQIHALDRVATGTGYGFLFFFLLALQPPLGVVFYSPLVSFSLLAYEVS